MLLSIRATNIIHENLYLSLATASNGIPWISPLAYAVDSEFTFYFISEQSAKHSTNIASNSFVAFCIFDSTVKPEDANGLQVEAKAYVLTEPEISHAVDVIQKRFGLQLLKSRFPEWNNPESYLDKSKFRIYKLIPEKFYMLDPETTASDRRVEVFPKSVF